jgi:hypothetical protein
MTQYHAILPSSVSTETSLAVSSWVAEQLDAIQEDTVLNEMFYSLSPNYACLLTGVFNSGLYSDGLSDSSKRQLAEFAYTTIWPLRGSLAALDLVLDIYQDGGDIEPSWVVRQAGQAEYPGMEPSDVWVVVDILDAPQRGVGSWSIINTAMPDLISVFVRLPATGEYTSFSLFHADYSFADEPVWS